MGTLYYSDGTPVKKAAPVNAHSHTLDRTQFANVGIANDGSIATPRPGQGLYFVGESPGPGVTEPGKWFAGDAPTKAPVNETLLANWFEPTSWNPPNDDNPDGAAGTWRPIHALGAGQSFSWEGPGPTGTDFGIPSETVDGYIRLRGDGLTVEWGAEVNSGARPIPYGAAGDIAASEYVYKVSALVRALSDFPDGSVGPWLLSIGMAFYVDNKVRDSLGTAPTPSLDKTVVWGANQYDITTTEGTDTWVLVDCYMNGRVLPTDLPLDAPVGERLKWDHYEPDGPADGFFFAPIIRVNGADVDVLVDSVQVTRGPRQITAPGGVLTTSVNVTSGDDETTINPESVTTKALVLEPDADGLIPMLPPDVVTSADGFGDTTWFTDPHQAFTNPLPDIVETVVIAWSDTQGARAVQAIPPERHEQTFVAGETYVFDASLVFAAGTYITDVWVELTSDYPGGTVVFAGAHANPPDDGTAVDYSVEWTPSVDHTGVYIGIAATATQWAGETTAVQSFQVYRRGERAGRIVGLLDPVEYSDPVTLGYLESADLGGGNTNVVHTPSVDNPEPVEDPDEPFETGALWLNPTAALGVPTMWVWQTSPGSDQLAIDGGWNDIPLFEQMGFYAPGPGVLFIHASVEVVTNNRFCQMRVWHDESSEHSYYIDRANLFNTGRSDVPVRVHLQPSGMMYFANAGSTIIKAQSNVDSDGSSYPKVKRAYFWCTWTPGAVMHVLGADEPDGLDASAENQPFARVRTAQSWEPATASRIPGLTTLPTTINIINASTSTTLSGGGTQNGGTRTLTATVSSGSGTPVGSVRFKRGSTVVATKTLSNGRATYGVTNTGTTSWTAEYLGGTSGATKFLTSTSGTTSVTIRTLRSSTVTRNKSWRDLYPERNGQNPSDPSYTKNNSYYSQHDFRQGRVSSTWGNWRTNIGFTGVSGVSNLHDVTSVKLKIDIDHSYYSTINLDIGWHTKGDRPTRHAVGSGAMNKQGVNVGQGVKTITLNSWARDAVKRSDFRGIVLGSKDSGDYGHYGYGAGTLQLIISYRYWA